ncbi:MAG: ABC transporter ATP-binding protein/permease, partial [Bacilli bacterium]|nr:ABC transporter ATP-binding protein/permease [Bacilli bacterium]
VSLGLLVVSYLLYKLFYYINIKLYGKNMNYCYGSLQTRLLAKLANVDDKFTNHISKGKLLNSINSDVLDIGDMCDQVSELFTTILQVIGICLIVSLYNVYLALIILVYAFLYIGIRNYTDRKASVYLKKQKHAVDRYSSLFSQILSGLQEIKTFDMMPKLKNKLDEIKEQYSDGYMMKRKYLIVRDNDIRFMTHGFKLVLYVVLLVLMIDGKIMVDVLVLVTGYFETTITYLDRLISSTTTIREVNVAVERVNSILNYKVSDEITYGNIYNDNIDGIVEFNNVRFGYNKKEILKGINFKIEAKSLTAIVGQSGTGKTSIINLLLRLYKPNSGSILIDGVDIFEYSKEVYKSNVSVVNQKPFIFNMSIRKNLSFVDSNVEHQIEACKRVGIHDFITSLPKGYNTVLRENGSNISGGQKQLISLARTLLSKSEILLFDEITSSLDPDTASNIDDILKDLKKDHTIIMITHKPELMKKADRIIVLHEGKIVGDGKHKDLLANNEHYKWLQARKSASKLGVFDND